MSKAVLLLVAAVILGGLLGLLMMQDAGYVLVAYGDAALETSLWFALLLLAAAYALVRLTLKMLGQLLRGGSALNAWGLERRIRAAHNQLQKGQWADALEALQGLQAQAPKHPLVMQGLLRAHEGLGHWGTLIDLLPSARKAKALDAAALDNLEREAWRRRIETDDGLQAWRQGPKSLRQDPALISAVAHKMQAIGDGDGAEQLLRESLNRAWHDDLLRLYGRLRSPTPEKQQARVEGWLKKRPDDGELLLAAGRLALVNADWPKAREYLEASLRSSPKPATQAELGRLLSALGEPARGSELLVKAVGNLPDLPLPARSEASSPRHPAH